MRKFVLLWVCNNAFLGTGHLTVSAMNEDAARDLFLKSFPVCDLRAILEID